MFTGYRFQNISIDFTWWLLKKCLQARHLFGVMFQDIRAVEAGKCFRFYFVLRQSLLGAFMSLFRVQISMFKTSLVFSTLIYGSSFGSHILHSTTGVFPTKLPE